TLVAKDRSWRLVLTCRDYSADQVRTSLLEFAKVGHAVVTVPPLDDDELDEVAEAQPEMVRPLANPALRRLLRNPFFLDKALQISWSDDRSLPQSERELRDLFWRQIVRAEHQAGAGMPRRREDVFISISLQRARELRMYTSCHDLDPEVVSGLVGDSLIVVSEQSDDLVAPAHDVLEDWAILKWIERMYHIHGGSTRELASSVGPHPAVRRTYRKWVTELVEHDAQAADQLFEDTTCDRTLPTHFRDDTFVSLLRSSLAPSFLDRHQAELFANDKELFRRIIRLLRVACVTTPDLLGRLTFVPSSLNVPDGPAWPSVLRLVQARIDSFGPEDLPLLLGFIEDWARGITWQNPYPEGADSAWAIAFALLPYCDSYSSEDKRKRVLKVIAKIPKVDPERFATLLSGTRQVEERDRLADEMQEIIFEGLDGMPAARDLPELVVAVARRYLLCSEADVEHELRFGSSLELEPLFGIKPHRSFGHLPPSAFRGPYYQLLRHHPRIGLDFIVDVFNHSVDWYAHPRVPPKFVEPPYEITLTFDDGTKRRQWVNPRLWNLYRGSAVGPYVLQSLLMALERWLFDLGESRPEELDSTLLEILRQSDSAALTAVVASVATAFPQAAGEALLVLLSCRECIELDRIRLASEANSTSRVASALPRVDPSDDIYVDERTKSDTRPHRRHDLEIAICQLQFGPLAPRVQEMLDQHRAALSPENERVEDDRVWRLALHRMDMRQYEVANPGEGEDKEESEYRSSDGDGTTVVLLKPRDPAPDVKEMVDKAAARSEYICARQDLLMWGLSVFRQENDPMYDPGQWRDRLQQAMALTDTESSEAAVRLGRGGPGYVAAVCARDHWDEMSPQEREWCVDCICCEIEREADNWDRTARIQRYSMGADRPCAYVLPSLLGRPLPEPQ
ncbi:MAG: AAA family ATPase, partial [Bacillota bacterium]